MHAKDSAAEPLLGDRRGSNAGQGAVSGVQKWPSGRRLLTVATTPRAMPAVAQQQAREPAPARSRVSPDRLRATHRDWKLSERHHRHKLTLAYLGESEMSGPPFSVCYVQLSRRELTIDVLFSSYPAGREALYADANGVPLPESQVPSMSPCSSSVPQPSPSTQTPGPSAPHFGGQQAHGLQAQMSRLPSGLLFSRRVEQLVGGFIRTRDVRMIDPTFSRELAELGMVGGAGLGAAQQSSPAQSLILVRCGAIIIRLFHLRAIVVHDGLYIVFDPRAAGSADADAVRAVALRLKASTQEDRLGGPDNEIASRRELDARDAHARDAMSTSRSELSLLARLDGDSVASGPPAPARAESCVSANESDIDMAALLHAAGPGPVLVGCSHIGAGEGRAHAHAPPDDEPAAAAPPQYTHGRQGRAAIGADEVQAHAGRPYAAASVRAVPAAAALSGARAVLEQGGSAGAAPGAAPGAAVPPRFTPRAADVAAADEGPSADLPPFPLRALEAIFDVVVDDLKSRLAALKDETRGALHALRLAVADPFGGLDDSVSFEVVRSLRERVRALTVSVRGAARAVAEVLDDDVQMAFIYLKKVHFAPELYEQDPNFRSQHEEVELLFESYLNALSSLQAALETVEYSIDSSERFVAQRLSSQRNGLLRLDVTFTVITAAISLCSFITGVFGMNLSSGVEELFEPWPFVGVTVLLVTVIAGTAAVMTYAPQVVYSARLIGRARRKQLHVDEILPRMMASFRTNGGSLGNAGFASLLGSGKPQQ